MTCMIARRNAEHSYAAPNASMSSCAGHLRPTTAKELQDCSSPKMAKLAATIDNSLDIAVEAVKRLSNDFKVFSTPVHVL